MLKYTWVAMVRVKLLGSFASSRVGLGAGNYKFTSESGNFSFV